MTPQAPSPDAQFEQLGNEIVESLVASVHSAVARAEQAPQDDGPQVYGASAFSVKPYLKQVLIGVVPMLVDAFANKVPGISTIELSNFIISKLNERL